MIVIFPMLTSSSVSSNILPGICKMIEKHILLYNMDLIINKVKKNADIRRVGMSLRLKENVIKDDKKIPYTSVKSGDHEERTYPAGAFGIPPGGGRGGGRGGGGGPTITGNEPDAEGKKKKKNAAGRDLTISLGGGGKQRPKTDIAAPKIEQALALEPTWVKVETRDGYSLLGVKVVPFPVASDERVIQLMIEDKSLSFWKKTLKRHHRQAMRSAHRAIRYFGKFVGYKGGDLTGDPKKDIIFAATANKRNVITLLDQADIEDDVFLKDIGGIQKLFQLGWNSFAVADDTAAKVTFCMRQFKGTCSIIPYKMIYSALGTEQRKVYDDLEDIKQRSGAIFRAKTNVRKLFGETMANKKIQKYEPITESKVMSFAKTLKTSSKSISAGIDSAAKKGDKKALEKALSKVPKMNIEQIESFCAKFSPNFKANHAVNRKVIKNSIKGIPDDIAIATSCILSVGTHKLPGDPKKNNAKAVKMFVVSARESGGIQVTFDALKKSAEVISKAPDIAAGTKEAEAAKRAAKENVFKFINAILNSVQIAAEVVHTLWKTSAELLPGEGEKFRNLPGVVGTKLKWVGGVLGTILTILLSSNVLTVAVVVALVLIFIAWLTRRA